MAPYCTRIYWFSCGCKAGTAVCSLKCMFLYQLIWNCGCFMLTAMVIWIPEDVFTLTMSAKKLPWMFCSFILYFYISLSLHLSGTFCSLLANPCFHKINFKGEQKVKKNRVVIDSQALKFENLDISLDGLR